MDVKVIGIDIAKRYFQVHAVDASGTIAMRRKDLARSFPKAHRRITLPALLAWKQARAPTIGHARSYVWAMTFD